MADISRRSYGGLTPEEERLKIRDISLAAESQSKEGDTFYLITQRFLPFSISFSVSRFSICIQIGKISKIAVFFLA